MIVAMHLILFPLGRVIGHRLPVDFRQSLVIMASSRTVVAVRPARSRLARLVAVVVIIIVVSVSVSVHLREPRLGLPAVQCRRQGHRVDLDVLPVFLREHRMGHARRGEHRSAHTNTTVISEHVLIYLTRVIILCIFELWPGTQVTTTRGSLARFGSTSTSVRRVYAASRYEHRLIIIPQYSGALTVILKGSCPIVLKGCRPSG